jgi:type IX secretion system PorP/SprF family membrane protein
MRRIFYVLLCITCLSPGISQAQDPQFSQFFASPLTLNPALTGKFNGTIRVAGNYRNQWPQINNAFVTSTLSVDGNILPNKISAGEAWGVGIMAMNDRTANGILTSIMLLFQRHIRRLWMKTDGIRSGSVSGLLRNKGLMERN